MTKAEWKKDEAAQRKTWIFLSAMGAMLILLFAPLPHWKWAHSDTAAKPPVIAHQQMQAKGTK